MNALRRPIVLLLSTLLLAVGCPSPPPGPPIGEAIPDFALVNRSDRAFERSELDGNLWIVDLIFTSCEATCPMQTAQMKELATRYADYPELRYLSISVDPGTDSPERLRAYAEQQGVGDLPWTFATGPKDEIADLVREGFRLPIMNATGDGPLTHSSRFVLLDRQGRNRGAYESLEAQGVAQLERDLGFLLTHEQQS